MRTQQVGLKDKEKFIVEKQALQTQSAETKEQEDNQLDQAPQIQVEDQSSPSTNFLNDDIQKTQEIINQMKNYSSNSLNGKQIEQKVVLSADKSQVLDILLLRPGKNAMKRSMKRYLKKRAMQKLVMPNLFNARQIFLDLLLIKYDYIEQKPSHVILIDNLLSQAESIFLQGEVVEQHLIEREKMQKQQMIMIIKTKVEDLSKPQLQCSISAKTLSQGNEFIRAERVSMLHKKCQGCFAAKKVSNSKLYEKQSELHVNERQLQEQEIDINIEKTIENLQELQGSSKFSVQEYQETELRRDQEAFMLYKKQYRSLTAKWMKNQKLYEQQYGLYSNEIQMLEQETMQMKEQKMIIKIDKTIEKLSKLQGQYSFSAHEVYREARLSKAQKEFMLQKMQYVWLSAKGIENQKCCEKQYGLQAIERHMQEQEMMINTNKRIESLSKPQSSFLAWQLYKMTGFTYHQQVYMLHQRQLGLFTEKGEKNLQLYENQYKLHIEEVICSKYESQYFNNQIRLQNQQNISVAYQYLKASDKNSNNEGQKHGRCQKIAEKVNQYFLIQKQQLEPQKYLRNLEEISENNQIVKANKIQKPLYQRYNKINKQCSLLQVDKIKNDVELILPKRTNNKRLQNSHLNIQQLLQQLTSQKKQKMYLIQIQDLQIQIGLTQAKRNNLINLIKQKKMNQQIQEFITKLISKQCHMFKQNTISHKKFQECNTYLFEENFRAKNMYQTYKYSQQELNQQTQGFIANNSKIFNQYKLLGGGSGNSRIISIKRQNNNIFKEIQNVQEDQFVDFMGIYEKFYTNGKTSCEVLEYEIYTLIEALDKQKSLIFILTIRTKVIELINLLINYYMIIILKNDKRYLQSELDENQMRLKRLQESCFQNRKSYPCFDLCQYFDILISLNSQLNGIDKINQRLPLQIAETVLEFVKFGAGFTSIFGAIDTLSKINGEDIQKRFSELQQVVNEIYQSSQEVGDQALEQYTSYSQNKILAIWLRKIQQLGDKLRDENQQIIFYLQQINEIHNKGNLEIILFVYVQLNYLLEKKLQDDNLNSLTKFLKSNKQENLILDFINQHQFKNHYSTTIFEIIKTSEQFKFRQLKICLLLKFSQILKNLKYLKKYNKLMTYLCMTYLSEIEISVNIIFKGNQQIKDFMKKTNKYTEEIVNESTQSYQILRNVLQDEQKLNKIESKEDNIQPISQMKDISEESDITIHKKKISSSFLKMQSKEKANPIEMSKVNDQNLQTIETSDKEKSINRIKVEKFDKNQMISNDQDKREVISNELTVQHDTNRNRQQIGTLEDEQPIVEQQKSQQQPNQENQLQSQNETIQYDDTQENCNKIISGILEYDFAEFEQGDQQNQIFQIDCEQSDNEIQMNDIFIQFRKWSDIIFNQQNKNLSQNFVQNRGVILGELGKFNYFICKQFFSQESMDLFVGYSQNNKGQLCDYIFKIYYSPPTSDILDEIEYIKKYDQIKNDQVVQNYLIQIPENIQILIMSNKTFLKLQSKSKKFQLLSFRYWNKKFFNDINDDKPFQFIQLQMHRNNCKNCLRHEDCYQVRNLKKFQLQQDKILDKLQEKGIFLCEYVNEEGEGVIFEGYRKNQQDYDDFIFKIQFESDEEDIQEQIEIMKLFEMNINVIKFIDFFKIQDNNLKIYVFILEQWKYSLQDELLIFYKNKKSFTKTQLFKIIFDLLDGLLQLRIYNILHLDIKPANILLSNQGNYIYTNFEISSIKKDGQKTQIKGFTKYYASPEQQQLDPNTDFKSDVYSLGITFLKVIDIYEKLSNDESIKFFKDNIIKKKMINPYKISRDNCVNIHESFLQTLIETNNEKEIQANYIHKIETILKLYSYDKNKDIPFILNLKLYYSLKLLYLFGVQISHLNLVKIDIPFSIYDSKSPHITIQQTNNLNRFELNILKKTVQFVKNISVCYDNIGKYQNCLEYLNICLQMRKQIFIKNHPDIATSLFNVGSCYIRLGDNKKALQYSLESLQMQKQIFKENHPDIAASLSNVGLCYQNLGDNKKAFEYSLESLQMRKQIFKESHPDIAISLNNIGICYQNLGDNKKALEYSLESLQIRKQIFKEIHPDISESLSNVGSCYIHLGDNKKALEYQLESLQMRKQIFKENHPDIAKSLNNVGLCYQNLGDNKKALEYQLESLEMRKQIFKENHPDIATSLNNVGSCYKNLGDNKKALEYSLESLQMSKQIFKENHPLIAVSLNNVGSCYRNLGDNKKALEYQLESLQMRKQIFKENHPDIAASLNSVGVCYFHLGDSKKALEYSLESLYMTKQIFKENHPDISESLSNVGSCYIHLGDNKKALEYQLESLQMRKQIFKENHPDIAKSLNNVGLCYQNLGDNKKALEYQLESLQMQKQIFKENHPDIATSLNNVGLCYQNLSDNKKALEYQLESLQMQKQIFKENHPDIATSLNNVGLCYQNLGDNKKALEYQLESLEMRKQIFKENHPSIAVSLNNVGLCFFYLGDNKKALEYSLESLYMTKQIFKENHPIIEVSLDNFRFCYQNLGVKKIALEYLQEFLQTFK